MEVIAFYIMATIITLTALGVIVARNPVHSVLFLIMTFFTAAGLLVLIGAEFLAMLLVVVYVGAVAVLFLFVVMMLDVDFVELKQGAMQYWPMAALVGMAFFAEISLVAFSRMGGRGDAFDVSTTMGGISNTEAIGQVMYTDNLVLFQMAGIILLIAMIGAIVLTLRHKPHVKRQSVADQTARRRKDATELVDVKPGQGI